MGSKVHITMVDALKLYNSLISGYQKAFSNKKGQEIQQEVSKLWKEIKKRKQNSAGFSFSNRKKTWRVEADRIAKKKRKTTFFLVYGMRI